MATWRFWQKQCVKARMTSWNYNQSLVYTDHLPWRKGQLWRIISMASHPYWVPSFPQTSQSLGTAPLNSRNFPQQSWQPKEKKNGPKVYISVASPRLACSGWLTGVGEGLQLYHNMASDASVSLLVWPKSDAKASSNALAFTLWWCHFPVMLEVM